MKHLTIAFLFISSVAFSQTTKTDTSKPAPTVIRSYYDTVRIKIYYEDGSNLKVKKGFEVRQIETNSTTPNSPKLLSAFIYDEKFRVFKAPVFNITQIQ